MSVVLSSVLKVKVNRRVIHELRVIPVLCIFYKPISVNMIYIFLGEKGFIEKCMVNLKSNTVFLNMLKSCYDLACPSIKLVFTYVIGSNSTPQFSRCEALIDRTYVTGDVTEGEPPNSFVS